MSSITPHSEIKQAIQVKICGVTDSKDLLMLDQAGVDYAGIWFNVPNGKYALDKAAFVNLARTPVNKLQCIGVTTEGSPGIISEFAREASLGGIQLHGFQLPIEVSAIKRRLDENVLLLKILHIQNGRCMEKPLLKEYQSCGVDIFILDNFISRAQSGSTGQRIPVETVTTLVDILGADQVFLAGGLDEQAIRELRESVPIRGVDIDTGARLDSQIDRQRVSKIVSATSSPIGLI